MQSYELFPTSDVSLFTFSVISVSILCLFCANWVIKGSDPLMIQRAGNSVFLAGFHWGNAVYLSGSAGSYLGDTREIPGRYPPD